MDALPALSDGLATAVQHAGRALCAVHARPRVPSSGVHWRQGVIVTAERFTDAEQARLREHVRQAHPGENLPADAGVAETLRRFNVEREA